MDKEVNMSAVTQEDSCSAVKDMTMEQAYDELDRLLAEMENGDHTLEETFAMYSRGIQLVKCCHEKIDSVEKKLMILEENGGLTDGE